MKKGMMVNNKRGSIVALAVLVTMIGAALTGCSGSSSEGQVQLNTPAPKPQDAPPGTVAPGDGPRGDSAR